MGLATPYNFPFQPVSTRFENGKNQFLPLSSGKNRFLPVPITNPFSLCRHALKMASTGSCHLIMARTGSCHSHILPINQTPRISPKSRPLIGRELRILASDWCRGLSENIQRGYPYDPEPLPVMGVARTGSCHYKVARTGSCHLEMARTGSCHLKVARTGSCHYQSVSTQG